MWWLTFITCLHLYMQQQYSSSTRSDGLNTQFFFIIPYNILIMQCTVAKYANPLNHFYRFIASKNKSCCLEATLLFWSFWQLSIRKTKHQFLLSSLFQFCVLVMSDDEVNIRNLSHLYLFLFTCPSLKEFLFVY